MSRLFVHVIDLAGTSKLVPVADFPSLLIRCRELAAEFPKKMILPLNLDGVDGASFDGFTRSEQDRLSIEIGLGRREGLALTMERKVGRR